KIVLPDESLVPRVKSAMAGASMEIEIGNLPDALATADLALTKTGTVATECAVAGVPAVTFYKASWLTYLYAKQVVTVKWLTLPNILANEELFPEFVQNDATPETISRAALDLL